MSVTSRTSIISSLVTIVGRVVVGAIQQNGLHHNGGQEIGVKISSKNTLLLELRPGFALQSIDGGGYSGKPLLLGGTTLSNISTMELPLHLYGQLRPVNRTSFCAPAIQVPVDVLSSHSLTHSSTHRLHL